MLRCVVESEGKIVGSIKSFVKHAAFGPPGNRLRLIKSGLLKGLKFHVDTQAKTMRLIGLDEREITSSVQSLSKRADMAMDIGANDGWYTQYFASLDNIRKVFAFEPLVPFIAGMQANLDANDPKFKAKIEIIGKMVGDKNDAEWISVDSLMSQFSGTLLLKIDVDGGELDVLHGAAETLQKIKCLIVMETHSPELEKNCIAYLEGIGYRCRIIQQGWYRSIVPEGRGIDFNQWFVAERP